MGGCTPATANAVPCGGCAWQHALAFGWRFMIARWVTHSLVRLNRPASCRPSMSTRHMCSGVMKPFETRVGVHSTRLSPTRIVRLPPLPSVYSRAHIRRPMSTIRCLSSLIAGEWKNASISRADFGSRPGCQWYSWSGTTAPTAPAADPPAGAGPPWASRIRSRAEGVSTASGGISPIPRPLLSNASTSAPV